MLLRVLDTTTGALVGAVALGTASGIGTSAVAVDQRAGRVFVARADPTGGDSAGVVSVLDARSGAVLHRTTFPRRPTARTSSDILLARTTVGIDERTGHAFIAIPGANTVAVLDTHSGALLRTIGVGMAPGDLAVDAMQGRVFVYSDGDGFPGYTKLVSTLDGASGRLLRAVVVAHDPRGLNMPSQGAGDIVVDDQSGHVFVSSAYADSVSMLDATSGRLLRTVGGTRPGPMAVDTHTRRVFVLNGGGGTSNGVVTILDSATGRVVGNTPVGGLALPVTPVVDTRTGRVFVANDGGGTGSVSVLDARGGALLRTVTVGPHPFVTAVDGRSSRVFVTSLGAMDAAGHLTGPGSVSVLDAQSRMLLRTVPVGVEPAVIAVDERAGRAFVVNVAGDSHDALAAARSLVPGLPRPAPPCNSYGQVSTRCRFAPGSVTVLDATR